MSMEGPNMVSSRIIQAVVQSGMPGSKMVWAVLAPQCPTSQLFSMSLLKVGKVTCNCLNLFAMST
jgi:hypothetical protein